MKRLLSFLSRKQSESKAEISRLRTVFPKDAVRRRDEIPGLPPLSALEETRPDDTVIHVVAERKLWTIERVKPAKEDRVPDFHPASCRECGAHLELVCPNGHGGADEILADLTYSERVELPPQNPPAEKKKPKHSQTQTCTGCGCQMPKHTKGGRPPAHPKCERCKAA